jgi:hypothetical protein
MRRKKPDFMLGFFLCAAAQNRDFLRHIFQSVRKLYDEDGTIDGSRK